MPNDLKIDDDFILGHGQGLYQASQSASDLIDDQMAKDIKQYNGEFSDDERRWSKVLGTNRLFINKTYTNTQRILVDVLEAIYSDPEELVDIASWQSVSYESREITKSLLNYRLNGNPINFYHEAYEGSQDGIKVGMCVLKTYPELKTEGKGKDVVITDFEPRIECVPPEHIRLSSNATWKNYYKYPIIHRYRRTRNYLKQKGYKNVDFVPAANGIGSTNEVTEERTSGSPFTGNSGVYKEAEEIWVYETWDFLPGPDGNLVSGSYILLGDAEKPSVVGRGWEINELPYEFSRFEPVRSPFVIGFAYPEAHYIQGWSFPRITNALQLEINAEVNQHREAVARKLRPTTYINSEANVNLLSLVNRRIGGYVQGDLPPGQALGEIPSMEPTVTSLRARAMIDQDYAENGLPPNLLGSSSSEETATGSTQQLTNANKKIAFVIKNLAITGFLPAFKMLLRLEQTYETDQFIRQVTGRTLGWRFADDNYPPRLAIQGEFGLKVNLGINKQAQINKLLLIADRINQTNQAMGQLVQMGVVDPSQIRFKNPDTVYDMILSTLGHKNTEQFDFPAMAPPPQANQKGIPSPPSNVIDTTAEVSQMSPGAPGGLNVA